MKYCRQYLHLWGQLLSFNHIFPHISFCCCDLEGLLHIVNLKKLAQHKCETPRIVYWLSKMYRRTFCRECMYVCMYVCMFLFPIGCLQAMILNKIIKGNFSFWDWTLFKKIWSKSFMKNIHCNQKRRGYTNFSSGNDRCLKSLHILFIWTHFRQTNSLSPRSPCMW